MKKTLFALAMAASTFAAHADIVTQSDSFGYTTTNWNHTLGALQQFDSGLGTLNSITITLYGAIHQTLAAENMGATEDTLIPVAGGIISFRQGGGTVLSEVLPTTTGISFNATSFDGADDKAGTSGMNFGTLFAEASETVTLSGAALAAFIGTGTLSGFDIRAKANGRIDSDNGNLSSLVLTQALGRLTLVYDYTPNSQAVPEPATAALLGLGMMGLLAGRKRR